MTEGMRWRITKAVRASDLPAPARLIMLVLADVAEVGTAEIPERFTPSIRVLAQETGLDASTVKRHLNALDKAGWLDRTVPDGTAQGRMERTRYRLTLPPGCSVHPGAEEAGTPAQSAPPPGAEEATPRRTEHPPPAHPAPPDTDLSDPDQIEVRSTDLVVAERAEVEQLCRHLADRIEANGSKRPSITKKWRDSARLLIDRDGRTPERIHKAIDWCQDDEFWRGNILSMPKLREKYDQLAQHAQRANRGNGHKPSTTDQRVADALALRDKYAQMETQ